MIQIAINGNRTDPFVPKTTEAIGKFVDRQIKAFRKRLKNIPIGISTGAWIEPDLTKRLSHIASWNYFPDFVSINYHEIGFEKVTELITEKGIGIEVGLNSLESAKNFVDSKLEGSFIRILIEPMEQELQSAMETVEKIENQIQKSGPDLPFLLHGFDETCWDILKLAIERNYDTRIGFEDTLLLPNGLGAKTNSELMTKANEIKSSCQQRKKE